MKYIKSIFYSILILFVILVSILGFLLTTAPGMYVVIKLANIVTPGKIHIKTPSGRLLDSAGFASLSYNDETFDVQLTDVHINWSLNTLWNNQLTIHAFRADKVLVHIKDTPEAVEKVSDVEFNLPQLPFAIKIDEADINFIQIKQVAAVKEFYNLTFHVLLKRDLWTVKDATIDYENIHLLLNAYGNPLRPFTLTAKLQFAPVKSVPNGLSGQVELEGDFNHYKWHGYFNGPVKGTIQGSLKDAQNIQTHVYWKDAAWPLNAKNNTLKSEEGSIIITGSLTNLLVNVNAKFNAPVKAQLQIDTIVKNNKVDATTVLQLPHGIINSRIFYDALATPKFNGQVSTKNLDVSDFNIPLNELTLTSTFEGSSIETISTKTNLSARYLGHALRGYANYDLNQIKANVSLGMNTINVQGTLPYNIQANATLAEPHLLHPSLAGIQTKIDVKAQLSGAQHGTINVTVHPGAYQSPRDKSLPVIKFKGGTLTASLTPKLLKAKGAFIIDQQKTVDLALSMPEFTLNNPLKPTQIINGNIHATIQSLSFLQGLTPAVDKLQGQLRIGLNATGTFAKPALTGELILKDASVMIPEINLDLNPIQLKLETQRNNWKATGLIGSSGKTLTISGDGSISPIVKGQLKIQGNDFKAVNTGEYKINLSPDLVVGFKPGAIEVNGSILVPSAELKPVSFSNTVNLSEDAVFASARKEAAPLNVSTNILIKMGKDVALNIQGLQGFLDGEIEIKQQPQGAMYGVGELNVRDGKYKAYGQDLAIEQGQLLFTGGQISNPGIRLKAVRYFKNATSSFAGSNNLFDFDPKNLKNTSFSNKTSAGIQVSGRVNSPKITLFSVPGNMSQADILSMIILGRPANQASKSGGQLLLTAISSMNLDSGTGGANLMEQLKEKIGFDINIESGSEFNQQTKQVSDSTSVVVGKALSERIYLSYNIGLFSQDSNVLTLKYLLNKFFSIQVTASDIGSGIDFLYTHSTD